MNLVHLWIINRYVTDNPTGMSKMVRTKLMDTRSKPLTNFRSALAIMICYLFLFAMQLICISMGRKYKVLRVVRGSKNILPVQKGIFRNSIL